MVNIVSDRPALVDLAKMTNAILGVEDLDPRLKEAAVRAFFDEILTRGNEWRHEGGDDS